MKAADFDDLRASLEAVDCKIQVLESTLSDKEATLAENEASNDILIVEVERAREGEKRLTACSNELKAMVEKQEDEAFHYDIERTMILAKLTRAEGFRDVFKGKIHALEADLSSAPSTITLLRSKLTHSEEKLRQAWEAYKMYKSKARKCFGQLAYVFRVRNRA